MSNGKSPVRQPPLLVHLPGLLLATGEFCNGIFLTPITAKLTVQCFLGEKPSVDLTPFRYDRFAARAPA